MRRVALGLGDGGNAVTSALLRAAPALIALLIATAAPSPAKASPETLARASSNILFSPLDFALAPYVAGRTIYTNLRDSDDTMAVKIAYPLPGVIWVTGVQIGASVIRMVTGLLEIVPAIPLAFMEADIDPLFDPVERNSAVVDFQIADTFPVKFGVDYTSLPGY